MLNICIGYDPREAVAYHVLCHSIMRRASGPVRFTPIALCNLGTAFMRPRLPNQSTDFAISRFLTPWLSNYEGVSIFMDCDMLCLGDVYELAEYAHQEASDVLVVQHDYVPKVGTKFLGQVQEPYPKKNWSSLMVFNGYRTAVRRLTLDYVNTASPMELHQFKWANSVGELPRTWNHLVGEYDPHPGAKMVHFTLGGPWFKATRFCEYSDEWWAERLDMQSVIDLDCNPESTMLTGSNIGTSYGEAEEAKAQEAAPAAAPSSPTSSR